jgi:hypothetical protein
LRHHHPTTLHDSTSSSLGNPTITTSNKHTGNDLTCHEGKTIDLLSLMKLDSDATTTLENQQEQNDATLG